MAKATAWANTDTEARKRGEQTGLDTLVVHSVNYQYSFSGLSGFGDQAKALNDPPGEYARKGETQSN